MKYQDRLGDIGREFDEELEGCKENIENYAKQLDELQKLALSITLKDSDVDPDVLVNKCLNIQVFDSHLPK